MNVKILCLCGKKGSGKSTLAAFLERNQKEIFCGAVYRTAFARPMKELCIDLLGLTREQCYGMEEQKNTPTPIRWGNLPHYLRIRDYGERPTGSASDFMTAREVLQHVGNDIFRRMNPDCWVEKCLRDIRRTSIDGDVVVIEDCRFPNEVAGVRAAGGKCVLLTREPFADGHASENSLPTASAFDAVLDNAKHTGVHETQTHLVGLLREWGWAK